MQEKIEDKGWIFRCAPSLGKLEGDPGEVWGIEEYQNDGNNNGKGCADIDNQTYLPCVFFGLYGLPDFYSLWRHKGRKCILWAGSDITHFKNGYWLEDGGAIKISPRPLATWINKYCESYVENEVEQGVLRDLGIESKVVPSFMGDVSDFPLSYEHHDKVRLYTSVSGDNFELYGWGKIPQLARENPGVEFHLYGNTTESFKDRWGVFFPNIIIHGRVPKEQMNQETKEMTGALRLTEFDGFSEIIAKSLLWGQWPVSIIDYPGTIKPEKIYLLGKQMPIPNIASREWLLSIVNKYPWNQK